MVLSIESDNVTTKSLPVLSVPEVIVNTPESTIGPVSLQLIVTGFTEKSTAEPIAFLSVTRSVSVVLLQPLPYVSRGFNSVKSAFTPTNSTDPISGVVDERVALVISVNIPTGVPLLSMTEFIGNNTPFGSSKNTGLILNELVSRVEAVVQSASVGRSAVQNPTELVVPAVAAIFNTLLYDKKVVEVVVTYTEYLIPVPLPYTRIILFLKSTLFGATAKNAARTAPVPPVVLRFTVL